MSILLSRCFPERDITDIKIFNETHSVTNSAKMSLIFQLIFQLL